MTTWKRVAGISASAVLVIVAVGLPATVGIRPFVGPKMRPLADRRFEATPARLERGRYLATAVAPCIMCHSPLDASGGRLRIVAGKEFAGRSFASEGVPFVTAPNLTPDPETGTGTWSDDALARAIREGISHDGRTLFPIMQYERFRAMSDEDVASIVVYLRSLRPVRNALPATAVPFPINRLINALPEPIDAPVTPDLSTSEQRGKYIATLAVCGDCHTPRDEKGNVVAGMDFAGGTLLHFDGHRDVYSANITPAVNGIPYYTEDLFIETFRTGHVRDRKLDDFMPTAFYRNMTDHDLKDVFAYLKTLKPVNHYVDNAMPPTDCPRCGLRHGGGERNKIRTART